MKIPINGSTLTKSCYDFTVYNKRYQKQWYDIALSNYQRFPITYNFWRELFKLNL